MQYGTSQPQLYTTYSSNREAPLRQSAADQGGVYRSSQSVQQDQGWAYRSSQSARGGRGGKVSPPGHTEELLQVYLSQSVF